MDDLPYGLQQGTGKELPAGFKGYTDRIMKKALLLIYVNTLDFFIRLSMFSDTTLKLRYAPGFNKLRHFNGKARAYARFLSARRNVPAYRRFLSNENFAVVTINGLVPDLDAVPVSNKKNYVSLFELNERCRHGEMPNEGVI